MKSAKFISIPVSDGTEMEAYIAFPEISPSPAIIVLQEAFGVNNHIRNVADKLCEQGYTVIAPQLFHRTGKRVEIAYNDFSSVVPHYQATSTEGLSNDLKACYHWLQEQPNVIYNKTGSIGFCLGGRVSYLANAILPLAAAVSYYGSGIDKMLDLANQLHGTQLFFWGGLDKHILPENIAAVEKGMRESGKDFTNIIISYADHGFNCDERPSYSALASKEAWSYTLIFFENRLK